MALGARLLTVLEGVLIALDAIRANKVRAGLTILGVAVGVFVVVAMSSVVRGVNESFARDLEAAGPTSFFIYRRPIQAFRNCDGTEDTCPERRNPPLTLDEARGDGAPGEWSVVQVPRPSRSPSGPRGLHAKLDRRRRRRHPTGAKLHV